MPSSDFSSDRDWLMLRRPRPLVLAAITTSTARSTGYDIGYIAPILVPQHQQPRSTPPTSTINPYSHWACSASSNSLYKEGNSLIGIHRWIGPISERPCDKNCCWISCSWETALAKKETWYQWCLGALMRRGENCLGKTDFVLRWRFMYYE